MNRRHAGFTLTELLVSMALGLIILGIVGYAFHNTSRASRRAIEVIEGDLKARAVLDILQRDFGSVHPSAAMDINPGATGDVTMCVATKSEDPGPSVDLRWVKWSWSDEDSDGKADKIVFATSDDEPSKAIAALTLGSNNTVLEGLDEFSITFYTQTGAAVTTSPLGFSGDDPTGRPAWAEVKIKASEDIETPHILRIAIPGGKMP